LLEDDEAESMSLPFGPPELSAEDAGFGIPVEFSPSELLNGTVDADRSSAAAESKTL
jgi:hypothetical protein